MPGAITGDIVGSIRQGEDDKADIQFLPMRRDFGYSPTTAIDDGISRFVDWYGDDHRA